MAVVFDINDLSAEIQKDLSKELTLVPIDPYVEKMKKWGKGDIVHSSPKEPVFMLGIDKVKKEVRIPFFTAMCKMDAKPNRHKNFPKLCKKGIPKFGIDLRDYQVEPAEEALQQLKDCATTTLGLPPGWGKTILGAWLGGKANGPVIVFSHRIQICEAWVKTFELCYPQYSDSIWLVGENECKNFVDIPDTDGLKVPRFIICMDGRIDKVPEYMRDAIAVTIIDEAHLFCTRSRVKCLLSTEPKFVIAETATLNRPDGMHSMIQSMVGKHGVFRVSTKPYRLYIFNTYIAVPTIQGARGLDYGDLTKKLIENEDRNEQLVECIKSNMHRKIMVMVRYKNHIKILKKLLEANYIQVATLYGSQRNYSDSHVLLGTIPKMGTGFDEKNSCQDFGGRESDLLILLTSIANVELFVQVIGRVMRSKDPAIFYFRDNITVVKSHVKKVLETVEETKGVIHDMHYGESNLTIPNMDYSSGCGVIVKKKLKITIK